ncbi:MAG: NrdH-redoxin [Myxococcota bacterium]
MRTAPHVLVLLVAVSLPAGAAAPEPCDPDEALCEAPAVPEGPAAEEAATEAASDTLVVFWGVGCPRCEEARPFVRELVRRTPGLEAEWVEVRRSEEGRRRFERTMRRLDARAVGLPTFVLGDGYVVGWQAGVTDERLTTLVRGSEPGSPAALVLPLVGEIDPSAWSLLALTLVIGLVDGVNPCAMWVLVVLLSILVHVRSRRRLLLFGGTFVLVSGFVYFLFMTAWIGVFGLLGLSRAVTIVLGAVVTAMGLVNLKEVFWFKRGPSLMIPEKAKPGLYRRMRGIARSGRLPAALAGITALAFLVNLVELGCTLGLPAIYTRLLSLRTELSTAERLGCLALYNTAYIVPLALIVVTYAVTLHRVTLGERSARALKGISGVVLVILGLLLLLAPEAVG